MGRRRHPVIECRPGKAPVFLGGSRKKAGERADVIARLDPAEGRKAQQFLAEMDG